MKNKIFTLLITISLVFTGCELLDDPGAGDIRENVTGEWKVSEDSQNFGTSNYRVTITIDPADSTAVFIDNFYNQDGFDIKAIMNDVNFTIPDQTYRDILIKDGYGAASFNFKTITLYFYVDLGLGESEIDVVEAVLTRPQ